VIESRDVAHAPATYELPVPAAGVESTAAASIDDAAMVALAETFRILGDVTRVRILDVVSRGERCVQDIARHIDLSESAVSHQLRLLRSYRLVRTRRAGRQVFYTLDDQHIVKLFAQGLEHVQESARARPIMEVPEE
jgi:DNA-binding transcriptional ArsR family regulator